MRSAVRIDASGPVTTPSTSPGVELVAVVDATTPPRRSGRPGRTSRSRSAVPASPPALRGRRTAPRRAPVGQQRRGEVAERGRGPRRGPWPTASATSWRGGCSQSGSDARRSTSWWSSRRERTDDEPARLHAGRSRGSRCGRARPGSRCGRSRRRPAARGRSRPGCAARPCAVSVPSLSTAVERALHDVGAAPASDSALRSTPAPIGHRPLQLAPQHRRRRRRRAARRRGTGARSGEPRVDVPADVQLVDRRGARSHGSPTARIAPVGCGPLDAGRDRLDRTRAEDHALEQRVGRQPVGAVHAACSATSPAAHSPGSAVAPVEVGDDAAAQVVGGRGDRQPVGRRVEPDGARGRRRWSGSAASKCSSPVASSQTWSTPCSSIARGDGPATPRRGAAARRRSARRRRRAAAAPWPRSASDSSGRGMRRVVQRGGVELHELDVGDRARRPAAPWRRRRRWPPVGLVVTANSWPAPPVASSTWRARTSCGAPSASSGTHAPAATALDDQVEGERVLVQRRGRAPDRLDERPLDLGARWPRRRRGRPGPPSGRPRGPARGRRRSSRSNTAPSAISSSTRRGPSSTSTRTASTSHRPAPAARVSARWRSVSSGSPDSTAATPPWAHRVVAWSSSPLVSTPTRRP